MTRIVLPDTSLLRNFVEIGRFELVAQFCDGQAPAWADQVAEECSLQKLDLRPLRKVFGRPLTPTAAQATDALQLRQDFFPPKHGDPNRRAEDLGECVTFAIWASLALPHEIFFMLTEDVAVVKFCHATRREQSRQAQFMGGRKAVAVTSTDLLNALATRGEITPATVREVEHALCRARRPLIGRARDIM